MTLRLQEILQFGFDNYRDISLTGLLRGLWLLWNSYICDIKINVGTFHMSRETDPYLLCFVKWILYLMFLEVDPYMTTVCPCYLFACSRDVVPWSFPYLAHLFRMT